MACRSLANAGNFISLNIGILGHVDSGKTALARALSTTASTAALDKSTQSKERGITLDLGFTFLSYDIDYCSTSSTYDRLLASSTPAGLESRQTTVHACLVDCPGHWSLLKTIVGGAQIIDGALLVIDVTKGIQAQTSECLVLCETLRLPFILILNKIDLIPEGSRVRKLIFLEKRLREAFKTAGYAAGMSVVGVSAVASLNLGALHDLFKASFHPPERKIQQPFRFLYDHCFSIKGQGSVMTGTVLCGQASVGQCVKDAATTDTSTIKSIESCRKPLFKAFAGDRIALCLPSFKPTLERGLVTAIEETVVKRSMLIASVHPIVFYSPQVLTNKRWNCMIHHFNSSCTARFICCPSEIKNRTPAETTDEQLMFDESKTYFTVKELPKELDKGSNYFVLLQFDTPFQCLLGSVYLCTSLDSSQKRCRIAFTGTAIHDVVDRAAILPVVSNERKSQPNGKSRERSVHQPPILLNNLRVVKTRHKIGKIAKINSNDRSLIGQGIFNDSSHVAQFLGCPMWLTLRTGSAHNGSRQSSTGLKGVLNKPFGGKGKFLVSFNVCPVEWLRARFAETVSASLNDVPPCDDGEELCHELKEKCDFETVVEMAYSKSVFSSKIHYAESLSDVPSDGSHET